RTRAELRTARLRICRRLARCGRAAGAPSRAPRTTQYGTAFRAALRRPQRSGRGVAGPGSQRDGPGAERPQPSSGVLVRSVGQRDRAPSAPAGRGRVSGAFLRFLGLFLGFWAFGLLGFWAFGLLGLGAFGPGGFFAVNHPPTTWRRRFWLAPPMRA